MPEPSADYILETKDATVLDLLDRLLDKGVMANGDLTLGAARVDFDPRPALCAVVRGRSRVAAS